MIKEDIFICPCCKKKNFNEDLYKLLKNLEEKTNLNLIITSGYRCQNYNEKVGGSPKSAHIKAMAVDILITSEKNRYTIVKEAMNLGIKRIGIYRNHIHIDIDNEKPQGVIWIS